MNDSSWLKANWLGIFGILLALIGLGSSFYFYKLSVKEREPILLEESFRPLLVEADSIKNYPLKIVNSDGSEIKKDLSSMRFYFWNNGSWPIKKSDILKPIQLELAANDVQIIDVKLLTSSRPDIVQPKLTLSNDKSNSFNLSFDILEKGDGLTVQVLYIGSHKVPLIVHGTIEGVSRIETNSDLTTYQFYKHFFSKVGFASIPGILLLIGILFTSFWQPQKFQFKNRLITICTFLIVPIVAMPIVLALNKPAKERLEQSARESILDIVPDTIRSEPIRKKIN